MARKKKNRLVPIRIVGREDEKPRQLCWNNLLKSRAESYPEGIEWFDQPARRWRKVSI